MKRFFIILSFFVALMVAGIFLIAIPKAEKNIANYLTNMGFKEVHIEGTQVNLTGLKIPDIKLDKDGFNVVKNTQIHIFWPTYFFRPEIKNIIIDEIAFSTLASDLKNLLKGLNKKDIITENLAQNITIHKLIYDVALKQKALRFEGRLNLQENEDQSHTLRATLDGIQHEVAFQSIWSGKINHGNDNFTLDGTFENIKIKSESFELNRGQGWLSYISDLSKNNLGMQINAGSGEFFKIPLQNLNVTLGQDQNGSPLLFRSNIIGIKNSKFTADFFYSHTPNQRKFQSKLFIPDQNKFLDVLKLNRVLDDLPEFKEPPLKVIDASFNYMTEKRFAGGPLPFDITINDNTSGTILIYPDSLDVRGNITGDQTTIDYLEMLINIPEEMMTENTIRIDDNLKNALKF